MNENFLKIIDNSGDLGQFLYNCPVTQLPLIVSIIDSKGKISELYIK